MSNKEKEEWIVILASHGITGTKAHRLLKDIEKKIKP